MRCNPVVTLYVRCIRLYFLILHTFIALIYFNQVGITIYAKAYCI